MVEKNNNVPSLTIRADEEGAAGAVKNFAKLQSDPKRAAELLAKAEEFKKFLAAAEKKG